MNKKDVNKLIKKANLKGKWGSIETWYAFQISCELYTHGLSNMSPSSKQEYCSRIPKKSRKVTGFNEEVMIYKKGIKRPDYDPLCCSWRVCPKLKDTLKNYR